MNIPGLVATATLFCSTAACMAATTIDFAITEVADNKTLILITAQKLDPHGVIQLQFPDEQWNTQCCQRLKASQFKPIRKKTLASNALTKGRAFVYETRLPARWQSGPFIGIAAIGPFEVTDSQAQLLAGHALQGPSLKATLCTSSEGVHLQARRGEELQTHLYLWLGYDIADPTCKSDISAE